MKDPPFKYGKKAAKQRLWKAEREAHRQNNLSHPPPPTFEARLPLPPQDRVFVSDQQPFEPRLRLPPELTFGAGPSHSHDISTVAPGPPLPLPEPAFAPGPPLPPVPAFVQGPSHSQGSRTTPEPLPTPDPKTPVNHRQFHAESVNETPAKGAKSADPSYRYSTHTQKSEAQYQDMHPSAFEVDTQFFLDFLLPALPGAISPGDLVEELLEKRRIDSSGRWRRYPLDPKQMSGSEKEIFANFEKVVGDINTVCAELTHENAIVTFYSNGDAAPDTQERDNSSRPDGYGIWDNDASGRHHPSWNTIGLTAEYKIKDTGDDTNDVRCVLPFYRHLAHVYCMPTGRTTRSRFGVFTSLWSMTLGDGAHGMSPSRTRRCGFGFAVVKWFSSRSRSTG